MSQTNTPNIFILCCPQSLVFYQTGPLTLRWSRREKGQSKAGSGGNKLEAKTKRHKKKKKKSQRNWNIKYRFTHRPHRLFMFLYPSHFFSIRRFQWREEEAKLGFPKKKKKMHPQLTTRASTRYPKICYSYYF